MSHHKEGDKDKKAAAQAKTGKPAETPKGGADADEQDVEGHNLFTMTDYYVQSKTGRQADIDKGARERSLVKEAKKNKPERR